MMKNNAIKTFLAIFVILLLQGCDDDKSSFGEDLQVLIAPTDLSYPDIINVREYTYIESAIPFVNSNGHAVFYEVLRITKDGQELDASYLSSVSILGFTTIETIHSDTGDIVLTEDLSVAGKIIIAAGNSFGNGEYLFTVKASVVINGDWVDSVFDDALRLMIGPDLIDDIAYCPFNMNFVSGANTSSNPAELFGGNDDVRFELGTESDKLAIDAVTGEISLNSSYTISATEVLKPIINVISNVSEEVVSFEEHFIATISTAPVVLDKEINYFYYPTLKPNNDNIPRAGGDGYTVETDDFASKPGWVQKHFYKKIQNGRTLEFNEVLATRTEAGVSGITGSQFNYWGPLKNPFKSWLIAEPVNLEAFSGCYDTKVVFWVKQNIPQNILDGVDFIGQTETPVNIQIKISDNYTGDIFNTDWTEINDLLTCKIGETGDEFIGTPYPLSGEIGVEGSANNLWVKCEMDLPASEYGSFSSFTIAFKTKTNYNSDLTNNLRGELYISDVHFVATEK